MTRLLTLFALLVIVLPGHAKRAPNIVLILADDLGWADLACYGNKFNETPHLDRLAQQGMRFTQFYAGPVCSPTRCNIQSGQNQARFGITQHIPGHRRPYAKLIDPVVPLQMPLEVETFAERLGVEGYQTGYLGKWHLGGAGFSPKDQGWQIAIETKGNTTPSETPGQSARRTTEFLTEKAIAFIEANREKPFLLQVSHNAVHIPLSTTPELLKKYQAKKPVSGYPSRPEYAGLLEELDQSVGRIAAALDRLGLAENTLLVFTSDNGGLETEQGGTVTTSNKPLRSEKGTLYEGGIRVPMIARWPGVIPSGRTSDAITVTMDFYPTFLEAAKLTPRVGQTLDGASLLPVLRDPAMRWTRDTLYWHLPHYHHSTPASALRQGDWKLLEFFETGALELYDLREDLGEQRNVAAKFPDRAQAMHTALKSWRTESNARMPEPNPNHDPARAQELGGRAEGKAKKAKKK
jgi:arylsulfatase A